MIKYKVDTSRHPSAYIKNDPWTSPAPVPTYVKYTSPFSSGDFRMFRQGPLDLREPGESWVDFFRKALEE